MSLWFYPFSLLLRRFGTVSLAALVSTALLVVSGILDAHLGEKLLRRYRADHGEDYIIRDCAYNGIVLDLGENYLLIPYTD